MPLVGMKQMARHALRRRAALAMAGAAGRHGRHIYDGGIVLRGWDAVATRQRRADGNRAVAVEAASVDRVRAMVEVCAHQSALVLLHAFDRGIFNDVTQLT